MAEKFSTDEDPYDPKHHAKYAEMSEDPVPYEPLSSGEFDTEEQAAARIRQFERTAEQKRLTDESLWDEAATAQIRIEALRAAAQVVAGAEEKPRDQNTGKVVGSAYATLVLAKQFAAWLETGE